MKLNGVSARKWSWLMLHTPAGFIKIQMNNVPVNIILHFSQCTTTTTTYHPIILNQPDIINRANVSTLKEQIRLSRSLGLHRDSHDTRLQFTITLDYIDFRKIDPILCVFSGSVPESLTRDWSSFDKIYNCFFFRENRTLEITNYLT